VTDFLEPDVDAIVGGVDQLQADLVVVGGTLAGLSLAIQAREAGVAKVLLLEPGEEVAAPELIGQHDLTVEFHTPVSRIEDGSGGRLTVEAGRLIVNARVVAIASRPAHPSAPPAYPIASAPADRVHLIPPDIDLVGSDVMIVGVDEDAAEYAWRLAGRRANVVLTLGGADLGALSRLARRHLLRLEAERRATILWNSRPDGLGEVGGFPMVYFGDRRTPDLQFDHVVFRLGGGGANLLGSLGIEVTDLTDEAVYLIDPSPPLDSALPAGVISVLPGRAWDHVRAKHFPEFPAAEVRPRAWRRADRAQFDELRGTHYNATITVFERSHSDLWMLRVQPDHGDTHHLAGQYASLGLGYWEPRADGARDPGLERSWDKLIRRSYSISSPLFDDRGYLFDPCRSPELEFYIVLVPPSSERIPALTPRLALKRPGDRIYLGPKVAGRYTLTSVNDPQHQIAFLATGTGEAPHNAMIVELLRNGHQGPIASVVSVRFQTDLGYLERHRRLESQFDNYHYLPLITRDRDQPKLYVQDVIIEDLLSERCGMPLDPARTDIYLCGNPLMIGLPEWGDGDYPRFPVASGACELLMDRGFVVDRRGRPGNVHYEEYW
jgi:ferredoxin--NADP+ reductase